MSLKNYNNKRDFNKTTEPKGKKNTTKTKKLKFVIQHHYARREHYDFRLEHNGILLSFAVPKGLPTEFNTKNLAVHVEDHPIEYINFKGTIPKGNYGAGIVEIFDKGEYIPKHSITSGLKKGHIKFKLIGKKIKGNYSLIKTNEPNWLIIKTDDEKIKNPFNKVDVKLALLSNNIPLKDYLFEIKYDGYRIVSFCEKNKIKLLSRNNVDYTLKFSEIVNSLESIDKTFVVDGEIVVFDSLGRSDFSLLQKSIKEKKQNFVYVIFDILSYMGKDLRQLALIERKQILEENFNNLPNNIMLSSYVINHGKQTFNFAKKHNLEGVVAKKIDSVYNSLRNLDWLKIKCYKRQEFVIGGYLTSEKNKTLSAILVGYYSNSDFIFIGKVGTGFSESVKTELSKKFNIIKRKTSPFKNLKNYNAIWLQPKVICEIQYAEITKSNALRQPSFIGLRKDKNPKDVVLEEINNKGK